MSAPRRDGRVRRGGTLVWVAALLTVLVGCAALAVDLAPRGIAVFLLHPGYVATDMVDGRGDITPDVAAQRLVGVVDGLGLDRSGSFWHSNGSELPW